MSSGGSNASGSGGSFGYKGRGGNSSRNGGNKFRQKNQDKKSKPKDKFKGKNKDLEGYIFDANKYNQANEYIKAVKEICQYVAQNYEYGSGQGRVVSRARRV